MQYARLEIVGNVVSDPSATFGQSTTRTELRLAATPRYQNSTGTWQDATTAYVTVTAFGHLAEHIVDTVTKGAALTVKARAQTSEWVDPATGANRSRLEFIATSVTATPPKTARPEPGL